MNETVEHFSAIIIGAGQAGPALAGRLTAAGRTVAIVERHHFGGTCVNTGCTPTKAMVASARVAHMARRASEFGVSVRGRVKVDLAAVKSRKDTILMKSRNGVRDWLFGMEGCTVIEAHARFVGPSRIQAGDRVLEADNVFINVGGRAVVPTWEGLSDVNWLDNGSLMELERLPKHLV
ncbi:MAG: FAD-dependent oxidoreductase, partial [Alphaproteobacteria bacterium]